MPREIVTTKILLDSLAKLRTISSIIAERQLDILDRLLEEEYHKVKDLKPKHRRSEIREKRKQ